MNINKIIHIVGTGAIIILIYHNLQYLKCIEKQNDNKLNIITMLMMQITMTSNMFENSLMIDNYIRNDNYMLIYRYTKDMCRTCYQEDLAELYKFQQKVGRNRILIIPAFEDNRSDVIQLRHELKNFNYVNIPADSMFTPVNQLNGIIQRYFAVINHEGKIEFMFFPQLGQCEITRKYFEKVEKIINV